MKKCHNIYKSTKLIHVLLGYTERAPTQDRIINSITITGDFFVYPEESLNQLEASLIDTKLEKYHVRQKIQRWLRGTQTQVFGFDSESLTKAIMGCLDNDETKI
ncbi:MAG: lipoate protein ligase C-terminal domain-containing protein [Candidatus Nitrosopolaris sp.]